MEEGKLGNVDGSMTSRLGVFWTEVKSSLWFVPTILTLTAVVLTLVTLEIDRALLTAGRPDSSVLFGGGAEGARGVLSSIAGGIITVTGVVFSITIVALQLASSQFTPRVLRNFTSDRANQIVLGVFIGTFTYTLLVLRSVRSAGPAGSADSVDQPFVPSLSVSVAIILALISIAYLIYFIHHTARSIQASTIIDRAARDALYRVDRLFPEPIGQAAGENRRDRTLPSAPPSVVAAEAGGYLQSVDQEALFDLASQDGLTVEMLRRVGDFVLPGSPLAAVWPDGATDDEVRAGVRQAFVLGSQRSPEHDLSFSITQLVDIAVKALSPGVNDPTTAKICASRLAEVLVVLGNRALPDETRTDDSGRVIFVARGTSFAEAVELAFDGIRHYGAGDPAVACHLIDTLGEIAALVPSGRRAPLARQAALVLVAAHDRIRDTSDLAEVDRSAGWLEERDHPADGARSQRAA